MIRRFEGDAPAFLLETAHTSYAFRVLPSGHLEQLWYGPRIAVTGAEELASLAEKRAFEPGNSIVYSPEHPLFVPDDTCLEYSAAGKGDLREPALALVRADGTRTVDPVFVSAEISPEKRPLEGLPAAYTEDGPAEQLRVLLRDAAGGVELELDYTVYADCDVICRSVLLTNGEAAPLRVERLMSMQLDLAGGPWAVSCFHGAWAREMERAVVPLPAGKFVVESRSGSSSARMNPFFMLHDPAATESAGLCYGFNLVYSGNHYGAVELSPMGKVRVVQGLQPEGFSWLLEPGESLQSPEAALCCSGEGFGALSRRLHRFVREHIVRGVWKKQARPVLLNSWEACYFDVSENGLVSLAKSGRELGVELFVMDDGWFGERSDDSSSLGDWEVNPKKLPHGLDGLAQRLNALGLRFGLWVEPEMVSVKSRLYEAHPDWAMAIPGRAHSEGRRQRVLDLANPDVQDWVIEAMTRLFSSAAVDYVKWDWNRPFSDVYSPFLPPERQGETAHRYILGLYRVMRTLTERFPQILFEGCASGGNRFDLGILSYFPQIWGSDDTDAAERARIEEGYSFGYPLSTVGAHVSAVPNHQTLRSSPASTRFNVAAFGLLGYEYDLRDLTAEQRQEIREQIALYKEWREVLQQGEFYRVESGGLREWCCVSPDKTRAVGLVMQELVRPNTQLHVFRAAGLDPERRYRFYSFAQPVNLKRFGGLINTIAPIHVRPDSLLHGAIARVKKMPGESEDCVASGASLMTAGVKLRQAFSGTGYDENVRFFQDFSSRLYLMEAIEE